MKKTLIFVIASAIMLAAGTLNANDKVFVGVNYEGNWGLLGGFGHTFGAVTTMPFYRLSIDSTLQDGIRFKQSTGIVTSVWLYKKGEWQFGLTASPFTFDWIDKQEEAIGTYWSGSGGFAVDYTGKDVGFRFWAKVKTDFKTESLYNDLYSFGAVATFDRFW